VSGFGFISVSRHVLKQSRRSRTRDPDHRITKNRLSIHLKTLSDFQPHPKACNEDGREGFLLNVGEWDAGSVSLTLQVSDRDRFRKGTLAAHSDTMVLGVRRQDFHLFKQPWTTKFARGEIERLELADGAEAICESEWLQSASSCPCHDAQTVPRSGTKIKLQNRR
jgi:hypothetical protein